MFIPEGYVSVKNTIQAIADANSDLMDLPSFNSTEEATEYYTQRYVEARTELATALASEKLQAFGIVDKTGAIMTIPSGYWRTSAAQEFMEAVYQEQYIYGLDGIETLKVMPIISGSFLRNSYPNVQYSGNFPSVLPKDYPVTEGNNQQPITKAEITVSDAHKHPGGRPTTYDWDTFWIEVVRFVDLNGLDAEVRLKCQKHMESWTAEKWENPPGESTIRGKLAKLFAAPVTIKK